MFGDNDGGAPRAILPTVKVTRVFTGENFHAVITDQLVYYQHISILALVTDVI